MQEILSARRVQALVLISVLFSLPSGAERDTFTLAGEEALVSQQIKGHHKKVQHKEQPELTAQPLYAKMQTHANGQLQHHNKVQHKLNAQPLRAKLQTHANEEVQHKVKHQDQLKLIARQLDTKMKEDDAVEGFNNVKVSIQGMLATHQQTIEESAAKSEELAGNIGSLLHGYGEHVDGMGEALKGVSESQQEMLMQYDKLSQLDQLKAASKGNDDLVMKAEYAAAEMRQDPEEDTSAIVDRYTDLSVQMPTKNIPKSQWTQHHWMENAKKWKHKAKKWKEMAG